MLLKPIGTIVERDCKSYQIIWHRAVINGEFCEYAIHPVELTNFSIKDIQYLSHRKLFNEEVNYYSTGSIVMYEDKEIVIIGARAVSTRSNKGWDYVGVPRSGIDLSQKEKSIENQLIYFNHEEIGLIKKA